MEEDKILLNPELTKEALSLLDEWTNGLNSSIPYSAECLLSGGALGFAVCVAVQKRREHETKENKQEVELKIPIDAVRDLDVYLCSEWDTELLLKDFINKIQKHVKICNPNERFFCSRSPRFYFEHTHITLQCIHFELGVHKKLPHQFHDLSHVQFIFDGTNIYGTKNAMSTSETGFVKAQFPIIRSERLKRIEQLGFRLISNVLPGLPFQQQEVISGYKICGHSYSSIKGYDWFEEVPASPVPLDLFRTKTLQQACDELDAKYTINHSEPSPSSFLFCQDREFLIRIPISPISNLTMKHFGTRFSVYFDLRTVLPPYMLKNVKSSFVFDLDGCGFGTPTHVTFDIIVKYSGGLFDILLCRNVHFLMSEESIATKDENDTIHSYSQSHTSSLENLALFPYVQSLFFDALHAKERLQLQQVNKTLSALLPTQYNSVCVSPQQQPHPIMYPKAKTVYVSLHNLKDGSSYTEKSNRMEPKRFFLSYECFPSLCHLLIHGEPGYYHYVLLDKRIIPKELSLSGARYFFICGGDWSKCKKLHLNKGLIPYIDASLPLLEELVMQDVHMSIDLHPESPYLLKNVKNHSLKNCYSNRKIFFDMENLESLQVSGIHKDFFWKHSKQLKHLKLEGTRILPSFEDQKEELLVFPCLQTLEIDLSYDSFNNDSLEIQSLLMEREWIEFLQKLHIASLFCLDSFKCCILSKRFEFSSTKDTHLHLEQKFRSYILELKSLSTLWY